MCYPSSEAVLESKPRQNFAYYHMSQQMVCMTHSVIIDKLHHCRFDYKLYIYNFVGQSDLKWPYMYPYIQYEYNKRTIRCTLDFLYLRQTSHISHCHSQLKFLFISIWTTHFCYNVICKNVITLLTASFYIFFLPLFPIHRTLVHYSLPIITSTS